MNCFVTGATGFIGSNVANKLLQNNYNVTGLTSSPEKTKLLEQKGVKPIVGDMREPEKWSSSVKDAEVIIHTATLPVPERPNKKYLNELSNAQESIIKELIEKAESCKVFIYTSGMTVYGSGNDIKTEESNLNPVELAKPYVKGEKLLMDAYNNMNFPAVILRPGAVYGDGGIFAKYWTTPISKGKRAALPGNGKQIKSFISVEDCAEVFLECVENPKPGESFNVVDDEPVSFKNIINKLAKEMDAPTPFGIPNPIFKLVGGKILGDMLLTDMKLSNKKIKEELGIKLKYPTYREGVTALAESFS